MKINVCDEWIWETYLNILESYVYGSLNNEFFDSLSKNHKLNFLTHLPVSDNVLSDIYSDINENIYNSELIMNDQNSMYITFEIFLRVITLILKNDGYISDDDICNGLQLNFTLDPRMDEQVTNLHLNFIKTKKYESKYNVRMNDITNYQELIDEVVFLIEIIVRKYIFNESTTEICNSESIINFYLLKNKNLDASSISKEIKRVKNLLR